MGMVTLCTAEWQNARASFSKVMGEKMWVTSNFELQNICAGLGLTPSLDEIEMALEQVQGKLDFEGLLRFVTYLKIKFYTPDPPDMDTVRAFVAVGGQADKSGTVDASNLIDVCKKFDLDIALESLVGAEFKEGAASANPSEAPEDSAAAEGDNATLASPDDAGTTTLEFTQFSGMFVGNPDGLDSLLEDDADDADEVNMRDAHPGPSPGATHTSGGPLGSPRPYLGIDYDALLAREMAEKGLPVPRARRPTDFLVQRTPSSSALARKMSRTSSLRQPAKHGGGHDATTTVHGHTFTAEKMRYFNELRAKGVPAELYGGDNVFPQETAKGGTPAEAGGPKGGGKKHAKNSKQGKAKAGTASDGAGAGGMRCLGRTGLIVDDPPKLYPQHLSVTNHTVLPPVRAHNAIHRRDRGVGGRGGQHSSPIITRIEQRMKELSKKKLSARYDKVQPRVNVTGYVQNVPPSPLVGNSELKAQFLRDLR